MLVSKIKPYMFKNKPHFGETANGSLQYGATSRNVGLSILFISEFEERGARKVTTGIGWVVSCRLYFTVLSLTKLFS